MQERCDSSNLWELLVHFLTSLKGCIPDNSSLYSTLVLSRPQVDLKKIPLHLVADWKVLQF